MQNHPPFASGMAGHRTLKTSTHIPIFYIAFAQRSSSYVDVTTFDSSCGMPLWSLIRLFICDKRDGAI